MLNQAAIFRYDDTKQPKKNLNTFDFVKIKNSFIRGHYQEREKTTKIKAENIFKLYIW